MALDFSELVLNPTGQITIPATFGGQTIALVTRTGKGSELTYLEGDASFIDVQVRNFKLTPNSGNEDTLTQILGGHPGTHLALRPSGSGISITIEDSANLHVPTGTITLSEPYHWVLFVCIGTDEYAKSLL